MASLYTEQSRNIRKTFFLMFFSFIVVISVGWFASYVFGSPVILFFVVIFAIVLNVFAYWKSDSIAIRLTGAKEITRDEYFDYWNAVENICLSIGAPVPSMYVIDDPSPNAFATGRDPEHSAIVVTTGLLELMEKTELEGVLAHELAHIQNRDTLLMTSLVVMFGFVVILLEMVLRFSAFGGGDDRGRSGLVLIIAMLAAYLLIPVLMSVIRLAISRKREFLADATAGVYTRYPEGLASALEKIERVHKPMRRVSSATAHLFISDPSASYAPRSGKATHSLKRRFGKVFHLFDTHPPIPDRVNALMGKN